MKLIALKPFRYAGVSLQPDEEFEASGKDARLLKAIGKAADAPVETVKAELINPAKLKPRTKSGE